MVIKYFKKLTRDPLFLFVAVGIFIFATYYSLDDDTHPGINLSSQVRLQLVEEYEAITGTLATAEVIARLEKNFIADELLFRDAINSGMHLTDPTTRSSLIEKMHFRISALITEPSASELLEYYAQNMQRYYSEASFSFEHVYFITLPMEAEFIVLKLQSGQLLTGDRFVHGNQLTDVSEGMLRGIFGDQFSIALRSLDSSQWEGPLSSNYGSHYVRLLNKKPPRPIPFSLAKNSIKTDLMQIKLDQAVALKIQALEANYEINIAP